MEYKMILATADLKTIYAVMVAKRKAPVAQVAEQRTRKPQVGFSINSWCSKMGSGLVTMWIKLGTPRNQASH